MDVEDLILIVSKFNGTLLTEIIFGEISMIGLYGKIHISVYDNLNVKG